jgi:hypothetical protein
MLVKDENIMLKRLGFVDKKRVWEWVESQKVELKKERWNGKENSSGRECLWFGVGVELGFKCSVFKGKEIDRGLRLVGNKWWNGDDWNSALLYKYDIGIELKEHVDKSIFDNKVVVINISQDDLFGGNVEFIYNNRIELLSNGEVIEFNNKVIHGVKKCKSERWSLSFRKVVA